MKSLKLPLFALGLACATVGCESQVGPEFKGESQFSLSGELVLGEDSRDLVPALAFWLPETKEVAVVDVEVSGSFPANFRIDVLTPPPAGAMGDYYGLGDAVPAMIVVVPKDHPATYPASVLTSHSHGRTCGQGGCEVTRRACVGEACYEQDLQCKWTDPCVVIEETGDPNLANDPAAESSTWHAGASASDHRVEIERSCVPGGACHEVAKRCPLDPPYTRIEDYYPAEVSDCTLVAERGDPALARASTLDDAIDGYTIVYAPRPFSYIAVDTLSRLDFEQGYNLIGVVDAVDDKTWLASIRCQEAAELEAKLELDRRHGTDTATTAATEGRAYLGISDAQQDELEQLMFEAAKDCPAGTRFEVVANPETAELKLHMGPRSSPGLF